MARFKVLDVINSSFTNVLASVSGPVFSTDGIQTISVTASVSDVTPSSVSFPASSVSVTGDVVSVPNHGMFNGSEVTLTTTGSLPGGLAPLTSYWVVAVDPNTLGFASSYSDSQASSKIDLMSQGSGVDTIVPKGPVQVFCLLKGSNDGLSWYGAQSGSPTLVWYPIDFLYACVVAANLNGSGYGAFSIDMSIVAKGID